jgi:hypothetical protein
MVAMQAALPTVLVSGALWLGLWAGDPSCCAHATPIPCMRCVYCLMPALMVLPSPMLAGYVPPHLRGVVGAGGEPGFFLSHFDGGSLGPAIARICIPPASLGAPATGTNDICTACACGL